MSPDCSNQRVFGTTPTLSDLAEARNLARECPISLDRIRDDELVRIATVWACFNELRRRLSKEEIADLLVAYLGADEIADWYSDRFSKVSAREHP